MNCIQCSALRLQWPIAVYSPIHMDCNSSFNVCLAISAILEGFARPGNGEACRSLYYYTRSSKQSGGKPCAYGEYLLAFRAAQHSRRAAGATEGWLDWARCTLPALWLPWVFFALATALLHVFARLVAAMAPTAASTPQPPRPSSFFLSALAEAPAAFSALVISVDYLLQVAYREHTFDNARFHANFPGLADREETPLEAFRRIGRRRQKSDHSPATTTAEAETLLQVASRRSPRRSPRRRNHAD